MDSRRQLREQLWLKMLVNPLVNHLHQLGEDETRSFFSELQSKVFDPSCAVRAGGLTSAGLHTSSAPRRSKNQKNNSASTLIVTPT